MRKENIEVINNILQLLLTIEEGLEHIKIQLEELRYEEALGLLEDSILGTDSIKNAIEPMKQELEEDNIVELGTVLEKNISKTISSYEDGRETNLEKQLEEGILPAFKNWKHELDKVLKPYIIS